MIAKQSVGNDTLTFGHTILDNLKSSCHRGSAEPCCQARGPVMQPFEVAILCNSNEFGSKNFSVKASAHGITLPLGIGIYTTLDSIALAPLSPAKPGEKGASVR